MCGGAILEELDKLCNFNRAGELPYTASSNNDSSQNHHFGKKNANNIKKDKFEITPL